ncbi:MAG TPA: hypothetical protein VLC12_09175, partial [Terriglobales bacterium]|nr:hypothetical protein [Terriglobales bacterium]
LLLAFAHPAFAQEDAPYFVAYDHHLEEPGNLELEMNSTIGVPRAGQRAYVAPFAELQYGVNRWWTSELYVEGQSTAGDSAVFTGWRLESRFRPLAGEHAVNPVFYLEYENINEASRIQKEIVGKAPLGFEPNSELRQAQAHELEAKLILSSDVHGWNVAENFIVERNLSQNEGFEFGYAFATSRRLTTSLSPRPCRFCRENFVGGLEFYGGVGSSVSFGLQQTAHYAAPVLAWELSDKSTFSISPALGLTRYSNPVLLRLGYSYEIRGFRNKLIKLFRSH